MLWWQDELVRHLKDNISSRTLWNPQEPNSYCYWRNSEHPHRHKETILPLIVTIPIFRLLIIALHPSYLSPLNHINLIVNYTRLQTFPVAHRGLVCIAVTVIKGLVGNRSPEKERKEEKKKTFKAFPFRRPPTRTLLLPVVTMLYLVIGSVNLWIETCCLWDQPCLPAWTEAVSCDTRCLLFHLPPQSNWITSEKSTQKPLNWSSLRFYCPDLQGGLGGELISSKGKTATTVTVQKMQAVPLWGLDQKNSQTMPTSIFLIWRNFWQPGSACIVQRKAIQTGWRGSDVLGTRLQ